MKQVLFGMLLVFCHLVNAQEKETTTLYRYGKPLDTCEANFENLFANVPKYLDNKEDLDLLSYKYVGIVKDASQARKFLKKNFSHYPQWVVATSYQGYESSSAGIRPIGKSMVQLMPNSTTLSFLNIKEMIKTISNEYIIPGDSIYLLRFVYNMETFEQYIFVHSDTKELVTKGTVFGSDIRLSHFDYINNIKESK